MHKTTSNGDLVEFSKRAISFERDETVKTIEVSTLADGLQEDTEIFKVNLYKSYTSTTPDATTSAHVKDVFNGSFNYSITSNGSKSDTAISEGTDLEMTITRDGSGSASTLYVSTENVTTSTDDLAQLIYKPIQFSAKETVKTVTISTHEDTATEGTETLKLNLYDGPGQTVPVTSSDVYIQDNWSPDFNYIVYSSAPTEQTAVSEGETITFSVVRTGSGANSTVYLKSFFNNAMPNDLISSADIELNFSTTQTVLTFDVTTSQNKFLETTESFGYELYASKTSTVPENSAIAYIKDKPFEHFEYTLTADSGGAMSVNEGDTFALNVTRQGSGSASEVFISTRHGTTTAADFQSISKKKIIFTSQETLKSIPIEIYGDSILDDSEFFYVELYLNQNDTKPVYSSKVDVKDIQKTSTFSYSISNPKVNEGEDAVFKITRDGSGEASSVWVSTFDATADASDYSALTLTNVKFSKKDTTKTIEIATFKDSDVEGSTPEYFWLDLYKDKSDYQSDNYAAYAKAEIIDTTSETDKNYTYQLASKSGNTVNEGETKTFTITRDGSGTESTVYIKTSDGTANSNDYESLNTTAVKFKSNETKKTISVDTYSDNEAEDSEYFYVGLFDSVAAANNESDYLTYDHAVIENVAVSSEYIYSVENVDIKEGETATFNVLRNGSDKASTIYISTAAFEAEEGEFEEISAQEVTFGAGELSKSFTVATYTDSITESDESFYIGVYSSSYAAKYDQEDYIGWAKGTIGDSGISTYNYSVEDISVSEGETATFTITRDGSDSASTIYFNTTPEDAGIGDFESISAQELVFAAGDTVKTVNVATYTDNIAENNEVFYLDLYTSYAEAIERLNYIEWAEANVLNVDIVNQYNYSVDLASATEGETATFTITRSGSEATSRVFVNTVGADAEKGEFESLIAKAVTFEIGELTKTVNVETYSDSLIEDDEYYYVAVYSSQADAKSADDSNYVAWNYGKIKDGNGGTKTYTYSVENVSVTEGETATFTIIRDSSDGDSTVFFNTTPDDASINDFESVSGKEVAFVEGETSKTVSVNTYADSELEEVQHGKV